MNPNAIIDKIGTTAEVARICDVTDSAVSQWRTNGIPKPWLMFFREKYPHAFEQDGKFPAKHCKQKRKAA